MTTATMHRDNVTAAPMIRADDYVLMPPADGSAPYFVRVVGATECTPLIGVAPRRRLLLATGELLELAELDRLLVRRWEPMGADADHGDRLRGPANYWTHGDPAELDAALLPDAETTRILDAIAGRDGQAGDQLRVELLATADRAIVAV